METTTRDEVVERHRLRIQQKCIDRGTKTSAKSVISCFRKVVECTDNWTQTEKKSVSEYSDCLGEKIGKCPLALDISHLQDTTTETFFGTSSNSRNLASLESSPPNFHFQTSIVGSPSQHLPGIVQSTHIVSNRVEKIGVSNADSLDVGQHRPSRQNLFDNSESSSPYLNQLRKK